jgi:hypothetical protein
VSTGSSVVEGAGFRVRTANPTGEAECDMLRNLLEDRVETLVWQSSKEIFVCNFVLSGVCQRAISGKPSAPPRSAYQQCTKTNSHFTVVLHDLSLDYHIFQTKVSLGSTDL